MNNNIRLLRTQKKMSQAQLALKAGTTTATISKLETGQRQLDLEWMDKIAQALEVHICDLIDIDYAEKAPPKQISEALSVECLDELLKEALVLIKAGHPVEFVFDTIESIARIIAAPGAEPISRNEIHLRMDTAVRLHGAPVRPK